MGTKMRMREDPQLQEFIEEEIVNTFEENREKNQVKS